MILQHKDYFSCVWESKVVCCLVFSRNGKLCVFTCCCIKWSSCFLCCLLSYFLNCCSVTFPDRFIIAGHIRHYNCFWLLALLFKSVSCIAVFTFVQSFAGIFSVLKVISNSYEQIVLALLSFLLVSWNLIECNTVRSLFLAAEVIGLSWILISTILLVTNCESIFSFILYFIGSNVAKTNQCFWEIDDLMLTSCSRERIQVLLLLINLLLIENSSSCIDFSLLIGNQLVI